MKKKATGENSLPASEIEADACSSDLTLIEEEFLKLNDMALGIAQKIPQSIVILDEDRRCVFANQYLLDFLNCEHLNEIQGKRPGDLLHCIHATNETGGCGTTRFCKECGAVTAILNAQHTASEQVEECRIRSTSGQSFDFKVWVAPYKFKNKELLITCLQDISHVKRREALEQTFFHDANNMLSAILGCSDLMEVSNEDDEQLISIIKQSGEELSAEIQSHKQLLQAEDGELLPELSYRVDSKDFLCSLINKSSSVWPNYQFTIDHCDGLVFNTDITLLTRIIHNMVKNAVEASPNNAAISVSCRKKDQTAVFSVGNPSFIPESIQVQIFNRSFSTKGKGRGIGTYSMKLFGEQYLNGRVGFTTSQSKGTLFFIALPLDPINEDSMV